jgi:site-specific DNA recombinase
LAKVESDYDNDLIDGRRYAAKSARIRAEQQANERQLASHGTNGALAELFKSPDPAQAFLDSGLMAQRAVIDALSVVKLHKGTRHSKAFDPETIKVTPRGAR